MFRIISSPSEPTRTFVADTVADLSRITEDRRYDEQGTTAFVLEDKNVYMLDGGKKWVKV